MMRRFIQPARLHRMAVLIALCACVPLGHASYMNAKAGLAQILLQRTWQQRLDSGMAGKPWPWADTTAVARLRVARLGIDEIILSGDSGRTLAFGPGWAPSSALPGMPGVSVVSAHRDTHFAFLRELEVGDRIEIDNGNSNGARSLRIASLRIVDSTSQHIETTPDADVLLLVTCYPFDALHAGGPLRFVVTAVPASSS